MKQNNHQIADKKIILVILLILAFVIWYKETAKETSTKKDIPKYNIHEHIESFKQAGALLKAMDKAGIQTTVLLGSPKETIFSGTGFTNYKRNNEEILKIIDKHPDRFIFFVTVGTEENNVEYVDDFIKKGAKGIKLYNGLSAVFYPFLGPLNRTEMIPLYEYAEKNEIPIIYHVNPGKKFIFDEFITILEQFPNLRIICPHFCLSSINVTRLEFLMDKFPNLYTDISFGFFVEDGLNRISNKPEEYKKLFKKYPDRIMFGTDMVVTSHKRKTVDWMYNLTKCYIDMLEKDKYLCTVMPDFSGEFRGLLLDSETLNKVYYYNAIKFLEIQPS